MRQDREEWRSRLEKRKADLERLKAGTMKNGPREAFEYNQKYADEILNSIHIYLYTSLANYQFLIPIFSRSYRIQGEKEQHSKVKYIHIRDSNSAKSYRLK